MRYRLAVVFAFLVVSMAHVQGALDGSGRCGPYECRLSNPICRCESFCQEWSQRCWKSPTGCHCARGYARDDRGNCIPQTLCP
ncbi:hypothetical protein KR018_008040 [Drosophila ironensis]|nr:hypothetical protein KR018_008040 [Drosophila ironensis]